jgi:beta-phosphoglucomutase-like phosphatase (HAD superfamily)
MNIIFDMDGVISDTQKYHALAESKLLEKYGIFLEPAVITKRFAGVSDDEMFEIIFSEENKKMPNLEKIVKDKWSIMTNVVNDVEPMPFVVDLIKDLKRHNFLLAVASSSPKMFIEKVLNNLGITPYFNVLVSADEVNNGKPAPDIFLKAANSLGVSPNSCLVIEDGESGIIGAVKAGMATIAYRLDTSLADNKVDDMRKISEILFLD